MRLVLTLATSALTITSMWLVGRHQWQGWALGLANQALWLAVIVSTRAWGLLVLLVFLVVVYTKNLLRWRRMIVL